MLILTRIYILTQALHPKSIHPKDVASRSILRESFFCVELRVRTGLETEIMVEVTDIERTNVVARAVGYLVAGSSIVIGIALIAC